MKSDDPLMLGAWSNGRWLYLDLARNRYLAGRCAPDSERRLKQAKAAAQLQDSSLILDTLIPKNGMLLHFMRSAWRAWRIRNAPIQQQLALLRMTPEGRHRSAQPRDVEHCAAMFQHLRNLRPRRPLCLQDSVGCALFLRQYVTPLSFHLGVVQPPFKAHAWVQSGQLVLNDRKQAVEEYTEIARLDL
ncbi:lasso peptide biosynthesis B2 protein [Ramlibacter sp.]|uniref:lasso peptide biosynthesis B2 protein n=1 Tax=Ramlibacter sp. TaxID=1917967 RepID=UPI0018381CD9|nr:lasso peptide biosynthesis B2 protein [Ramlibacter sp.]MBA2672524.1 lasso peptide biosynthesis B2 protein [Ramlibacter sp.]